MSAPLMPQHADDCDWTIRKNTCTCAHPDYIDAIGTVAREVIRACVDHAIGDLVDWDSYPELPELVWRDVVREVGRRTRESDYSEAYRRLSELAEAVA